jgi:methylmalonyl-CoA/ethylmalonyl-CoA epimerase
MILRIDHIGVVARSYEEATDHFLGVLGFTLDQDRIPDPHGYHMLRENALIHFIRPGTGETMIELLLPQDEVTGMGRWLARRGPSVHHICYGVDDVEETAAELVAKGLNRIDMGAAHVAFFYPKSTMGILTELVDDRTFDELRVSAAFDARNRIENG